MDAPTTADLVAASTVADFTGGTSPQQDRWAASGRSAWLRFTGAVLDQVSPDDEPLVFDAIRALSELAALDQNSDRQETLADFDLIKSFSAGSYSETRRDPGDAIKARMLVALPWLNTRLWDFMTPDKRAYWIDFFSNPNEIPASSVTEVDWSRGLSSGSPPWGYDGPGGVYDDFDHGPGY